MVTRDYFVEPLILFSLDFGEDSCKMASTMFILSDIDECLDGSHGCSVKDVCTNTDGSYECHCKNGFVGDGRNCTGMFTIVFSIIFQINTQI